MAIQNAEVANRPKEAILRAISKASQGGLAAYHEVTYEGYGRHGAAIIVVCMTDKMIRTIDNVRAIFTKYGSSLEKVVRLLSYLITKGALPFLQLI